MLAADRRDPNLAAQECPGARQRQIEFDGLKQKDNEHWRAIGELALEFVRSLQGRISSSEFLELLAEPAELPLVLEYSSRGWVAGFQRKPQLGSQNPTGSLMRIRSMV